MKEEITIIDSYRKLPVGKYLEALTISEDENLSPLEKQVSILSILTNLTEDYILRLPIMDYQALAKKSTFLQQQSEDDHTRIAKSYIVGDFILVPTADFRKVTTAQYVDFHSFTDNGDTSHLVEMLSCFLVPKGMEYGEGYDILEVQDAIRNHLMVSDFLSLCAFFLIRWQTSIADSLSYSKRMLKGARMSPEQKMEMSAKIERVEKALRTNGDGSRM